VFRQGLLDSVFKEALVSRGLSEHLRRGINRITRTQVQASWLQAYYGFPAFSWL